VFARTVTASFDVNRANELADFGESVKDQIGSGRFPVCLSGSSLPMWKQVRRCRSQLSMTKLRSWSRRQRSIQFCLRWADSW